MTVTFSGSTLEVNGKMVSLPYSIVPAFELGPVIVVLFDPDSFTEVTGQFRNLVGVDVQGEVTWTAELPTSDSDDRYYKIASTNPLVVYSVKSFECALDATNGRILSRLFFK